jgi:hypothetical protein
MKIRGLLIKLFYNMINNKQDKNRKFFHCNFFPKNRRGDIPITILVVGVVLVCAIALISFLSSSIKVRNSFVGIGLVEQLDAQIEENSFYGNVSSGETSDLNKIINEAKNSKTVDRTCKCGSNCGDYATWILQSALHNGIQDPVILLSLMMQESDCTANAFSGSSVGLMQINLANCGSYGLPSDSVMCKQELIDNPAMNIEIGAKILREKYDTFKDGKVFVGCSRTVNYADWEAALRGYNGWGCGTDSSGKKITSQDNFVEEVMRRTEILKGNYVEKETTNGILWWAKKIVSFSVNYKQ